MVRPGADFAESSVKAKFAEPTSLLKNSLGTYSDPRSGTKHTGFVAIQG